MKKFLALLAIVVLLTGEFAEAKKKKQRKCCGQCKPKKPPQACAEKAVDVIFVLDGSSSVGPKNFTVAQEFMTGIVKKFNVSPSGVKIGLLQYSTSPRIEFNLNDHKNKKSVISAINSIDWILGDTHTALALRETYNSMIAPQVRSSPNRNRFVIVITDGDPQDFKEVPAAVEKLVKDKVQIFAIGVGDATRNELQKLSEDSTKSVFYADNYESAKVFTSTLVDLICKKTD